MNDRAHSTVGGVWSDEGAAYWNRCPGGSSPSPPHRGQADPRASARLTL